MRRASFTLLSTIAACLFLVGCSSTNILGSDDQASEELQIDGVQELTTKAAPSTRQDDTEFIEEEILAEAQSYFERELYTLAKSKFDLLGQSAASQGLRQFAQIKSVDCLFFSGDVATAIEEYLAFVDAHPKSVLIPYAMFNAAQGQALQAPGVGRDPSPLTKAKQLYENLIRQYPQSAYSRLALEHFLKTEELLQEHNSRVTDFYADRQMNEAYKARLNAAVLAEQLKVSTAQELQELLKDAPLLNTPDRGLQQQDPQQKDLPKQKLEHHSTLADLSVTQSNLAELGNTVINSTGINSTGINSTGINTIEISQVACGPNQWDLVVYTSVQLAEGSIQASIEGDQVMFNLPTSGATLELPQECDQWKSSGPVVSRSGTRSANIIYMSNPPRAILMSGASDEVLDS